MNIGIDVDGVILDTEHLFKTYAEIFDIEVCKSGITNSEGFKVEDRYSWTEEQMDEYIDNFVFDIEKNAPLLPGAKYVIGKLKEMGHKLVVITARGTFFQQEADLAYERLDAEGFEFDKIVVNAEDKLPICQEEKIDIMIDDSPLNVTRLSENGIKCLYLKGLFDKDINNDNVTTVRNWGEVYRHILECGKTE